MAKIKAPNKQYTGISATVHFVNGIGETSDPALIEWFKEKGYEVEGEEPEKVDEPETEGEQPVEISEMTVKQLKAFAEANGINLGSARTKEEIIEVIESVSKTE